MAPQSRGLASAMPPKTTSGVNPLVRQLGLAEVQKRDATVPDEGTDLFNEDDHWQAASALAGHVRQAWMRNKLAKVKIDLKLLADLRARRGVYSAAQQAQMQEVLGGMNMVWAPLTEVKCRAASAWIREILLPAGEQPWGVAPTPIADLPMPIKKGIVGKAINQAQQIMQQTAQAGGGVMAPEEFRALVSELGEKLRDEAEKEVAKAAERRAKRMERQIADRLAQGNYEKAMDAFIEDFVTYPAAILKGPVYARHKTLEWGDGFKPIVRNDPTPTWERVSPFDAYPAPQSRSPQQGDFIERVRFRREELHDLKGVPGYQDDQIDQALRDYYNGHLEGWLWTEAERQRLEQETLYMWLSPPGVIDALNYWGSVPGWKLMSWGVAEDLEETREYEVNVLLCGRYVLYARLNPDPLSMRPYFKACYDEIPGSFWGRSIPDLASTPQQMCNAIACAQANNMSMASGPMVWVHADRLADGEQTMEIFPWKLWQLKSDPTQGVNPGIGFFQPNDNTNNLMLLYEKWEMRADDATGVPRYTYGNGVAAGAGDTAQGLSMLMNNAAKGLRRAISNVDMNVIAPTINVTFNNEMLYNKDESIKGDNIVIPRGAAAILIRESAQQRRMQFLGMTANPIDSQIITSKYRAALLREVASAMELPVDDVVPSDEVLTQMQDAAAQAQQKQIEDAQNFEREKIQFQAELDASKEKAIAAREDSTKQSDMIRDIVKQAVAGAMAEAKGKQPGGTKKLKYNYGEDGLISGAEVEEA